MTNSFVRVLSGLMLVALWPQLAVADYNQSIVNYCSRKIGTQVGSGECAHLATEAQRVAGAEFRRNGRQDSPIAGDYVWGTQVKKVWKDATTGGIYDSNPSNACRPGDIIQYRLNGGKTHHTTVVSAVNSKGYPTEVFQQNFNSQRYVSKDATDIIKKLKDVGGYVYIYRSTAPVGTGGTEFTLVNNAQSSNLSFSLNGKAGSIGGKNTSSGFATYWSSATPPKITVSGVAYSITNRKGYEFYSANGTTKLRALSQ